MGSTTKQQGVFCCFDADNSDDEVVSIQPKRGPTQTIQFQENDSVSFRVNGETKIVNATDLTVNTSLASYLRNELHLTGTKISCYQGGCGACIVTATIPTRNGIETMSVNSCLIPVLSCDSWDITTVEGLGNRKSGLHPIQERLAAFHGTQCGFCSPGMVMQMNSLLEKNPNTTIAEVEGILDGNICRCTGYRPIFDAFKSFAVDAPKEISDKVSDIEDLGSKTCCKKNGGRCKNNVRSLSCKTQVKHLVPTGQGEWFAPSNVDDLMAIISGLEVEKTIRFVGGNTGRGVFSPGSFDAYIDVKKVSELGEYSVTPILQVGGAVSLTQLISIFSNVAQSQGDAYKYVESLASHIKKVANTGVRNTGTVAGNLMLKHAHPEFPSDLFALFEAAGAKIIVRSTTGDFVLTPVDFLNFDMTRRLILKIEFPPLTALHHFASYKITPRSENAHAYVNGAFLAKVDDNFVVLEKPHLVYGGVSESFNLALNTEDFLVGKSLSDESVVKAALQVLAAEVEPTPDYVLASVEYRKHLTQALFYKFILSVLGDSADPKLQSGATQLFRNLSSGKQTFDTNPDLFPINQPLPKIEGQSQCSGEAEFINDIPSFPGELTGHFVLATIGNCEIDTVDASAALAIPGVLAFYDHTSLPGINQSVIYSNPEPIFTEGFVAYAGQAIGIIIAEDSGSARRGASAVKVTYKNLKKPILNIRDALANSKMSSKTQRHFTQGKQIVEISGEFEIGSQYHFHMETQSVVARPVEDLQYEIYSASQWMDHVQLVVAKALNIPEGSIEVKVRRMGGAYGAKISPPAQIAAAATLGALKLNRPVRVVLDMKTNMEMIGKRYAYLIQYSAGATPEGKLSFVDIHFFSDGGYVSNEAEVTEAIRFAKNCYHCDDWTLNGTEVITNKPSSKSCRAPGTTQGVAAIEQVMEHLASVLGMDPLEFRLANMIESSQGVPNPLPSSIIPQLITTSEYNQRVLDVEEFNQKNLWKKRGISLQPLLYPFICALPGITYYFTLSVYSGDGTIAISHSGHEMGQGINTKVVQTVAKKLNVPIELIHQKPANSFVSPNSIVSGGSATTDWICTAAILACDDLKARMDVVAATMVDPTWEELVLECYNQGVDLTAKRMGFGSRDNTDYDIWGAAVTEVEIDVLTGEKNITRVDIIEDTGTSVNPALDFGQIEGGFVMSLGLWLTEELKFHPETGRLLTFDSWEYKPPASHDIPEDFRVTFFNTTGSPAGVFGAKAVGEPAVLLGCSALLAIRHAITAIKTDLGEDPSNWFELFGPATTERIQLTSGVKSEHFRL